MAEHPGRPPTRPESLRLHMNENTAGCSPAVIEALRHASRTDVAFYPSYSSVTCQCARYIGVDPDWVLLTNGLDEGILCAMLVAFRSCERKAAGSATLVVDPSFEMYRYSRARSGPRWFGWPRRRTSAFPGRRPRRARRGLRLPHESQQSDRTAGPHRRHHRRGPRDAGRRASAARRGLLRVRRPDVRALAG